MSHFTVLVAIPAEQLTGVGRDLDRALAAALEPFDENLELDPWDEEIDRGELQYIVDRALEQGILTLPEGLAPVARPTSDDPEIREREARAHSDYIDAVVERLAPETVAEMMNHGISNSEVPAKVIAHRVMRQTTRNPEGYWDWWSLGGRWSGFLTGVELSDEEASSINPGEPSRDALRRDQLDLPARRAAGTLPITAALLIDGRWQQPARIGWFGSTHDQVMDNAEWEAHWCQQLESLPADTVLAMVDCHI